MKVKKHKDKSVTLTVPKDKKVTLTWIDVSKKTDELIGPYLPDYAVLFNPTPKEINALAKLRPRTFILSFITKDYREAIRTNYKKSLIKSDYIVMPFWIGNFHKQDWVKVARQYVDNAMWPDEPRVGDLYERQR